MALDKKYHLVAGFVIGLLAALYFSSPLVAVGAAGLAGLAKEIYDYVDNKLRARKGLPPAHDADLRDLTFTLYGGVIAAVAAAIVVLLA